MSKFDGFEIECARRFAEGGYGIDGLCSVGGLPGIIITNRSFQTTFVAAPDPSYCEMSRGEYRAMLMPLPKN